MRYLAAFLGLVFIAALAAGGAYTWFVDATGAPGPLREAAVVVIAPGAGVPVISRQLADAGVIEKRWMFELEARRSKQAHALKPGEYRFDPGISLAAALAKIVRRDVVAHFVTIPEGLVTADIRQILEDTPTLSGTVRAAVADGELLPETYRFEYGDTREAVIARMRSARTAVLADLWEARPPDLPLRTPEEAVILASIVEKETGIASERPHVASVFINRLRRGMRLQSDPTVIYGLAPATGTLERPLTKADLERPSPFNTYVIDRLPPAPICHPGRAALAAVLSPATTPDLYFVADGSGGHAFAATLAAHDRNVASWRKLQQNHSHERPQAR